MPKILLIEDDEDKAAKVIELVRECRPDVDVEHSRVFNGGLRALIDRSEEFALLLLDMTMPIYEPAPGDAVGGATEHLAGRDLLAQLDLRGIVVPTVIVTMFDSFGKGASKISLNQLEEKLAEDHPENFRGLVYFNQSQEDWKGALRRWITILDKLRAHIDR